MNLEKLLALCQEKLRSLLGDDLLSLVVYGSAAGEDYLVGRSDVNLALVMRRVDLAILDQMRIFMQTMRGHRLATPLLMTMEHIETSLDIFPIEFLEIQERHRVLWGTKVFASLNISTTNLRHECEHELKGRLLRLRQSYLENGDHRRRLQALLLSAHSANFPAFRAALRLRGQNPPVAKDEVEAKLCLLFALDLSVFQELRALRLRRGVASLASLKTLLDHYLVEVQKIAQAVDAH